METDSKATSELIKEILSEAAVGAKRVPYAVERTDRRRKFLLDAVTRLRVKLGSSFKMISDGNWAGVPQDLLVFNDDELHVIGFNWSSNKASRSAGNFVEKLRRVAASTGGRVLFAYFVSNTQMVSRVYSEYRSLEQELAQQVYVVFPLPYSSPQAQVCIEKGASDEAIRRIGGILRTARKSILLYDPYIDMTAVEVVCDCSDTAAEVNILTCNLGGGHKSNRFARKYQALKAGRRNLSVRISSKDEIHDRYLVIDEKVVWHLGASLKDLGKKMSMLSRIDDDLAAMKTIQAILKLWQEGQLI